jgi:formylglycine-generating enzyme
MRNLAALFCLATLAALGTDASAVTIQWSPVGNPGNAASAIGYGAVGYSYNIGTYDVTVNQYTEFLNSNDPTGANALGLYPNVEGDINYNAAGLPGSKYSAIAGDGLLPQTFVNWFSAIRFANWINNGQIPGSTETGAYTIGPLDPNGVAKLGPFGVGLPLDLNIARNPGATVFLPNIDEWYKAAYYDPRTTAQGGPPSDSHYWLYPTTSNTAPAATDPTAAPNSANYWLPSRVHGPSDIGAYTGTTSPIGAFDMAGNVEQWNESSPAGFGPYQLGGGFTSTSVSMSSYVGYVESETSWYPDLFVGFRLASVPEPSSILLSAIGLAGLLAWRRRPFCA